MATAEYAVLWFFITLVMGAFFCVLCSAVALAAKKLLARRGDAEPAPPAKPEAPSIPWWVVSYPGQPPMLAVRDEA